MNITSWLNQTIYVATKTGVDAFGNPTWGAPTAVKARVEGRMQRVVDTSGVEVVSDKQILTLTQIGQEDRIWLPGEDTSDTSKARIPKAIAEAPAKDGATQFWQVYL